MSDTPDEIKTALWKALDHSPFVLAELTDQPGSHAVPMTAQLDKDAHGAFWFYTGKDNRLAGGGPAMVQFAAKGHDLFACIAGTLTEETDGAIIDKHWNNYVAAWFDGGRDDPNLMMLRFDLGDAEVWTSDATVKGRFKLMTGMTVEPGEVGHHAKLDLTEG